MIKKTEQPTMQKRKCKQCHFCGIVNVVKTSEYTRLVPTLNFAKQTLYCLILKTTLLYILDDRNSDTPCLPSCNSGSSYFFLVTKHVNHA